MDDLLASIRKIIADDFAERSVVPREGEEERVEPAITQVAAEEQEVDPPIDDDPIGRIDEAVAQSIMDAFQNIESVDEPAGHTNAEPPIERTDPPPDPRTTLAAEETMQSVAAAIASEKDVRIEPRLTAEPRPVLSEPGLDDGHDARRTAPPTEAKPLSARTRLANLRRRPDPGPSISQPFAQRRDEERRPMQTANQEADAAPGDDGPMIDPDAPPSPSNVYRLDPDQRTPDMSETAAEPKPADDGQGNIFRRTTPPRTDHTDDSLTSARTRQTVNHSFEQLSRTILSNNPRTFEDLVRDMVRPLLREWLEANLADIVDRQVRQEIDRVSMRGR